MTAAPRSSPGSAFGDRRRTYAQDAPCPCGASRYGHCCGPILGGLPAPTAEALMRSRYTAFALRDRDHLEATWHPTTRPARLDLDDALRWRSLVIDDTDAGGPGDREGTVSFRARWQDTTTGERGELRERSRFVFRRNRWWYVDGDVAHS